MSAFNRPPEVSMSQTGADLPYERAQEYVSTTRYPTIMSPTMSQSPSSDSREHYESMDSGDDNDTVIVDNKMLFPSEHCFAEGDFIPPGFFDHATLNGFTRRFKYSQWSYEMRREAQLILPFLSLGPSSVLRDSNYLREQGFTLLLAIRNSQSALARLVSGEKAAAELGIQSDTIDVLDNQELISAFPRAIRRINDHLAGVDTEFSLPRHQSQDGMRKVLVFCETGNERSAAVVIAYVMTMMNLDVLEATRMIQQHRFCASIEDGMKRLLIAFDSILCAKRDVERVKHMAAESNMMMASTNLAPVPITKKRSFQVCRDEDTMMDDGDMDMDMEDGDYLSERKPMAPFRDRVL
ncbi:hypothetical protein N7488_002838 [Penicillium malachiteum]|nr:hypothetical protein N7488_002838 [Penicillium malachiteum]